MIVHAETAWYLTEQRRRQLTACGRRAHLTRAARRTARLSRKASRATKHAWMIVISATRGR